MKTDLLRILPRIFGVVLLAGMFAVAGGCKRGPEKGAGRSASAVPVQTAVAVQQDVAREISAIGTVQAQRSVSVKSQVDGVISAINFKEGDDVKAGDLLVTLDRRPFENSLRSAKADLANAMAMADQAKADLERYQRLDQQAAVSKEEYVNYVTKGDTTKALVQAKEAAVANAELQLSYAEIRAPIAGRTGQRLLHEGSLVKANDNNFSLVTINQLAPISVAYAVPEQSLDEIRAALKDHQASVTATERNSGLTREDGELDFVDNTVDPTTGMVTLKATFANADIAFWPGQFVYVTTKVGVDRNAIVVPTTAIQTSQSGSSVYVLKPDSTVELRPVKVARAAGSNTLLASGLKAGETVVTDGQLRLLPGMKAEPRLPSGAPIAKPGATNPSGKS